MRPSVFHFWMTTLVNISGFSSNLVCALWFGIANGQISSNFDRVICWRQLPIFSFPDDNLSKCQGILTKLGTCTCSDIKICFGIANGQISSIFGRVTFPRHDNGVVLLFYVFIYHNYNPVTIYCHATCIGSYYTPLGVIVVRVCEPVFQNLPHSYTWPLKKRTHSYTCASKMLTYSYTALWFFVPIYCWLLDKYHSQFIKYQKNKQPRKITIQKICAYTRIPEKMGPFT